VEVALELHDNPLIPVRWLPITAPRKALLYCSASKLVLPIGNDQWQLVTELMGINIPNAIELLNGFIASLFHLLTFRPVVGFLLFHLSFFRLNKLGKPSTLRLVSLVLMCQTS
jgi:hypothetical protein